MSRYIKRNLQNRQLADRIREKVVINPKTGCWEWQSAKDDKGYALIWYKGQSRRAHRLSYELFVGPLPDGYLACHACDNKGCVNPDHIWPGTNQDNIDDACLKGINARGSRSGRSKLTEAQVIEIRNLYAGGGHNQLELAAIYGVDGSVISEIVNRKIWRHI